MPGNLPGHQEKQILAAQCRSAHGHKSPLLIFALLNESFRLLPIRAIQLASRSDYG